jgi:TPR repeat protein
MVPRFASRLGLVVGLLVLLEAFGLGPAVAESGRHVALVIGNGAYVHTGPLVNPPNDAVAMAKLFTDAGFVTVVPRTDLDLREFRRALADFEVLARDAEVAIIYYSGHGLEFGGQNYLVPVDAAIERDVDIEDESVPLDRVLKAVAGASRLKLVILDACRTDPFKATARTKAVNRGFARVEPGDANELVAYAAKAGTVAADGEAGGHSPYTAALLKRLTVPGLDVELALRHVRDDVLAATHREQEPFYYGAMGGDELPLVQKPAEASPRPAPAETTTIARLETTPDPAIDTCDRLAASPYDTTRPAGVAGAGFDKIDATHAVPACRAALSARPDDPRIAFQLGRALSKAGNAEDEAAGLYRKAAEAGHGDGMYNLGVAYAEGRGVEKDEAEAVRWFRKAAEAGLSDGMYNLGVAYANGRGVEKDEVEAVRWYRKAADAGISDGMADLGLMYANGTGVAKDEAEAVRWYRKAAEAGNSTGMYNLGFMYEKGNGVAKDEAEAFRWYRKAAEAGNSDGIVNLGLMYENGNGVAKDEAEAVRWYRKAAEAGNSTGMNNLGTMYEGGTGVTKDLTQAMFWYRKAADAGNTDAKANLARLIKPKSKRAKG